MHLVDGSRATTADFHILVLDDDALEGKLLGNALLDARPGVSLHFVSAPAEAIRFLYHDAEFVGSPQPDLIFLDYRMPSNGGRVLSILKGDPDLRAIPVVALCVDASPADIKQIYDRHANCCINKPVEATDFSRDLRSALSFWMDVAVLRRGASGRMRVAIPLDGH